MEVKINKENFEAEVLQAKEPVMVDFFATWCGPCQMLGPVVADIAEEYNGKAKVCKLDIDESPELAIQYGVMAVPTILVFKNGEVSGKVVGYADKSELTALL